MPPIVADDDAAGAPNNIYNDAGSIDSKTFPYPLINRNHAPQAAGGDYPPPPPNDAASPD